MEGVGQLSYRLRKYVERNYSNEPVRTRAIIFALAYTKACQGIKVNNREVGTLNPSSATRSETIELLTQLAATTSNLELVCRDAANEFEALRSDMLTLSVTRLAEQLSDTVKTSVSDILEPILPEPEPSLDRKILRVVCSLVADSIRHAVIVFFAGLIFIAVGIALNRTGATIVPYLWTLVEEAFKPIQPNSQERTVAIKEAQPH